jgi:hypothetical protein
MFRLAHYNPHPQQQQPVINQMEFAAWLTATYSVDAGTLTAEQRTEFENKFVESADSYIIQCVTGTPKTIHAEPTDMDDPLDPVTAQAVADNSTRLAEIFEITRNHPAIGAEAIRGNWTLVETDRAVAEQEARQFSGW